jgi:hypothetical protein
MLRVERIRAKDGEGVWGQNHWSVEPLDRIGVNFFSLQNPKKSLL